MILLRVVDLAPEKSAVREALRAPWAVATPETLSRRRNRAGWPGKRPCRDVSTLPALSIGAPTYPLGFSGKPFSTAGLGSVLAIGRDGWAIFQINKSVPAKPAHHGDAGWEDRAAIRGGRRPRAGGAKPQEAVLFFSFGHVGAAGAELSTGKATLKLTVRLLIQRFFLDSRFRVPQTRRKLGKMTSKSEFWGRVA